ncbi:MAG: exodeoxyribonuclease III [Acidiferrobacteraceae bacterium]
MKIATWNVNSVRVRLPQLLSWLEAKRPDVLALQETKVEDDAFPRAEFAAAGYHTLCCGEKTYNGVALLSREALTDPCFELAPDDPQRRFLAATFRGVRIVNIYVPNGSSVGSDKYVYKLRWLDELADHLAATRDRYPYRLILGDFNIAPEDRDVHDPTVWVGSVLVSEAERERFHRLAREGWVDLFRRFSDASDCFSWWDYRQGAFRRNLGLRIDHILATPDMAACCLGCEIDTAPRRVERPSDHAPVIAEFSAWDASGPGR